MTSQTLLAALVAFWHTFGPGIVAMLIAGLPSLITGLTPKHPNVGGFLSFVLTVLEKLSITTHSDSPGTLKAPFVSSKEPTKPAIGIASTLTVLALLLFSGGARAQTFSAGLSVPLLEYQGKSGVPVQFAPGVGVQANLGLFPYTIAGMEADLLIVGAALFASAPGSLQVAALVGTFNVLYVGAAVPLSATDGSGAFQGAFHVYPVLGGSVAFELGKPPAPAAAGAPGASPRRFGTVYLGIL